MWIWVQNLMFLFIFRQNSTCHFLFCINYDKSNCTIHILQLTYAITFYVHNLHLKCALEYNVTIYINSLHSQSTITVLIHSAQSKSTVTILRHNLQSIHSTESTYTLTSTIISFTADVIDLSARSRRHWLNFMTSFVKMAAFKGHSGHGALLRCTRR